MRKKSLSLWIAISVFASTFAVDSMFPSHLAKAEDLPNEIDCSVQDCTELVRWIEFNTGSAQGSLYSPAGMTFGVKSREGIQSGWCSGGITDPLCREAETIGVHQSLTICDQSLSFDCIQSIEMILESGEEIPGTYFGSINSIPDQDGAISSLGPFVPDNAIRFRLPNGETETYFVDVPVSYNFGSISIGSVGSSNQPLARRAIDQIPTFSGGDIEIAQVARSPRTGVNSNQYSCIPIDGIMCWAKVSDGILRRFRIVIRRNTYSSSFEGGWGTWKSAGLGEPTVSFNVVSGPRPEVMTIEATQVGIPSISAKFHWSNINQRDEWNSLNQSLASVARWESRPWCGGPSSLGLGECPPLSGTFKPHNRLAYPNNMYVPDAFDLYRTLVSTIPRFDTANQISEEFFLRQQSPYNVNWNGCAVGGGFGFSTSNGLAIKNGLPSWNSLTNSIDIDVIAPHYASADVVHRGMYALVMPEQLVKCLWAKKKSDVLKVEISIYDEDGSQKSVVATSNLDNGVFNFRATGFTYSTSKIVIRSLVEKLGSTSRINLVRCRKRNSVRVFESKNTRCPSGWKKLSSRLKKT